jgi:hypothetical protein
VLLRIFQGAERVVDPVETDSDSPRSLTPPQIRLTHSFQRGAAGPTSRSGIADFIRFVLSRDGQLLTIKAGFYPVPNATRLQSLKSLGISGDAC